MIINPAPGQQRTFNGGDATVEKVTIQLDREYRELQAAATRIRTIREQLLTDHDQGELDERRPGSGAD